MIINSLVKRDGKFVNEWYPKSRLITCLSGGKASAWCANYALTKTNKPIFYFNDTKWEHPDLYRFLDDITKYLKVKITNDSDGRSPEDVAYDSHALPNNRMPFCSAVLKANRLQKFIKKGDTLIFGIGPNEMHRAKRIEEVYKAINKDITCIFPLIEQNISSADIDDWLAEIGIKQPELYNCGFKHNNCHGGCVRQGKNQWIKLLNVYPDIYAERERMEREFNEEFGTNYSFLKDTTLTDLRLLRDEIFADIDEVTECIGICGLQN